MKLTEHIHLPALLVTGIITVTPALACGDYSATFSFCNAAADAGPGVAITGTNITGTDSNISRSERHQIKSSKQWAEVWGRHKGLRKGDDSRGLPTVDFDKSMVIAIFEGTSREYPSIHDRSLRVRGLKVSSISEKPDRIVFEFGDLTDNDRNRLDLIRTRRATVAWEKAPRVTPYGFFIVPVKSKPIEIMKVISYQTVTSSEDISESALLAPVLPALRLETPGRDSVHVSVVTDSNSAGTSPGAVQLPATRADVPDDLIKPESPITGPESRIAKREYSRITSRNQWAELWCRHRGLDKVEDPAGLPRVDFRQSMVIAIFEGRAMNGSRVRVESISEEREHMVFRYKVQGYQTAFPSGRGIPCTVYGFFVVPRSAKSLVLEEGVGGYQVPTERFPHGRPPVWKKQVIFPEIPDFDAAG